MKTNEENLSPHVNRLEAEMKDYEEKNIKDELDNIFGKIDRIIKRIDTEDPMKTTAEEEQSRPDVASGQPPTAPPENPAD